MKKLLFTLAAASVMMVACKKKGAEEPTKTSEAVSAIISGKATAELNNTTDGREDVPNGTKVIAKVWRDGQYHRYETSVNNGMYSFSIPASNDGIEVDITFSEFRSDVKVDADNTNKDRVFGACDEWVSANPGQTQIIDVIWYDGGC
jgi:outer membrane lipoprotein-sorting protein